MQAEQQLSLAVSTGRRNTQTLQTQRAALIVKYRTRIYYTKQQKALMWGRWRAGDSLHEIAWLTDRLPRCGFSSLLTISQFRLDKYK